MPLPKRWKVERNVMRDGDGWAELYYLEGVSMTRPIYLSEGHKRKIMLLNAAWDGNENNGTYIKGVGTRVGAYWGGEPYYKLVFWETMNQRPWHQKSSRRREKVKP